MINPKLIELVKRIVIGKKERYKFAGNNLFFITGTRPIRRKYINAKDDVTRNDVLQIEYFEKYFKPGDILWDIGSHFGHYSIFAASVAAGAGQVLSFEPDSAAREILIRNIALNNLADKINVSDKAVCNTEGPVYFESLNGDSTSHIVKNESQEHGAIVAIDAITLDTLSATHPTPTFIKIDTEGAEIDILTKAELLLQNKNITFICELHPFAWDAFGVQYKTFADLLEKHGRQLRLLDEKKDMTDLPFYATVLF